MYLQTILSDNQDSTYLVEHGLCEIIFGQVKVKWGLASSDLCVCGQQQTINHMVNTCPFTKFRGGSIPTWSRW